MTDEQKFHQSAAAILSAVGGKENVASVFHCMTRLRFLLKDSSLPNIDEIKKIDGVLGAQLSGGQFQVIIGPNVAKVYTELCKIGGFTEQAAVDVDAAANNADKPKEKLTAKTIGQKILNGLTGSITPVLPIFICAGLLKMIVIILGPGMLGVLSETSGLYTVLSFAGDAGFYFLPVFLGYTSAKQFKANPLIGMLLGAILIHPSFIEAVTNGTSLDFLGLPITPMTYSSSVIPIILVVWVMSYVERFWNKVIPEMLKIMLVPFLTVLIMLPLSLVVLAPLGVILGSFISTFFLWLHSVLGPWGIALLGAVYALLIMTGMHHPLNLAVFATLSSVGYDKIVFVAGTSASMALAGIALAFAIKSKKAENRSIGFSSFFLLEIAGITEPTIYGIALPYVRPFIAQAIGGFCGALYMGFMNVKMYNLTGSNILGLTGFIGKDSGNFMHAVIGSIIAFVVAFVALFIIGFDEDKN
ncbi:PTS transporter subunit EIIC [Enterococcus asini]|uniref:PTS transporter subunit EIIC n=1 Tax=Enterococcus asini TaxID=57732 RepID=UPI000E5108B0|nr:PTS transporter subunit EIIC [Enterococcus asini]RGW12608.1 PTS fructose transporter subunit IIB [Enterococcus asini]